MSSPQLNAPTVEQKELPKEIAALEAPTKAPSVPEMPQANKNDSIAAISNVKFTGDTSYPTESVQTIVPPKPAVIIMNSSLIHSKSSLLESPEKTVVPPIPPTVAPSVTSTPDAVFSPYFSLLLILAELTFTTSTEDHRFTLHAPPTRKTYPDGKIAFFCDDSCS